MRWCFDSRRRTCGDGLSTMIRRCDRGRKKLKYKAECDELVRRQNSQHNESLRRQKEENLKYKAEYDESVRRQREESLQHKAECDES